MTEKKNEIVEVNGKRMRTNEMGLVVVVCKRNHEAYFAGNVHGMAPETAYKSIRDGESELHALSVVDGPEADDVDTEDDALDDDVVDGEGEGEGAPDKPARAGKKKASRRRS